MIAVAVLALLLDAPPPPDASAWCPIAAPPDTVVSCPGWKARPCRTRNARGQLIRSRAVIEEFKRATGYQRGRPGYVIDHIRPLCLEVEGLAACDVPWALTWERTDDARAKDRQEIAACKAAK